MPIYGNVCSGVAALAMKRRYGRRKYFKPASERSRFRRPLPDPQPGSSRLARLNHRENAADLDIKHYESITRPLGQGEG